MISNCLINIINTLGNKFLSYWISIHKQSDKIFLIISVLSSGNFVNKCCTCWCHRSTRLWPFWQKSILFATCFAPNKLSNWTISHETITEPRIAVSSECSNGVSLLWIQRIIKSNGLSISSISSLFTVPSFFTKEPSTLCKDRKPWIFATFSIRRLSTTFGKCSSHC